MPMKSPNMMSTTGRMPVIAPPTPIPVMAASEIGESITRLGPNSSTRPVSTLKAVPASATSSPMTKTVGSRRISSASASRMALPSVVSTIPWPTCWPCVTLLSVDMLVHLAGFWIGGVQRKRDARRNLLLHLLLKLLKDPGISSLFGNQTISQQLDGVAVRAPFLLLFFRAVIRALNVANMVAVIAVGIAQQEGWAFARARPLHQMLSGGIHPNHILAVDHLSMDAKGFGARAQIASGGFGNGGIFGVEIVFADVDDRQLPERGHIHRLVQHTLAQRAIAKEADRHLIAAAHLAGKRRAGCQRAAASHDGICPQVAGLLVGNMHRAAFAPAIARRFAQQFGKHAVHRRAFRQAVPMPAMRAGDVVIAPQRLADANRDSFFAAVQVGQPRHLGAGVEFVHLLLKETDGEHLLVDVQPVVTLPGKLPCFRLLSRRCVRMWHSTSPLCASLQAIPTTYLTYLRRRFTADASQPSAPSPRR